MGVGRTRGVVAVVATVACSLVSFAGGAHPASAGGPVTLSVSPSTNLVTGQVVAVSATGLPAFDDVAVVECAPGASDIFACQAAFSVGLSDGSGRFSTSLHVTRFAGVDCAKVACFIGIAAAPDPSFLATHALSFDASVPATTLSVTPSTKLPFIANLTVTGARWPANGFGVVQQCTADMFNCNQLGFTPVFTDAHGAFQTSMFVRRQFASFFPGFPPTDCVTYPGGCVIVAAAFDPNGTISTLSARLSFDPNAPIPPRPVLQITPNTKLADHQIVTLTGHGFTPGSLPALGECFASEHFSFCGLSGGLTPIDAQGHLPPTFFGARRILGTLTIGTNAGRTLGPLQQRARTLAAHFGTALERQILSSTTQLIDCAKPAFRCFIEVASAADGALDKVLSFDPGRPPAPAPVVSAHPTTNLKHRQIIQVAGHGFVPGETVLAVECLPGAHPFGEGFGCGPFSLIGNASAQGTVAAPFGVQRQVLGNTGPVDCAKATCQLRVFGSDDRTKAIPLQFDPGAPLPPPPSITVTPNRGLTDGQTVHVSGHSFTPSAAAFVGECATDGQPNPGIFDIIGCLEPTVAETDATGALSTPLTVSDNVPVFDGSVVDCTAGTNCVIVAEDLFDPTAIAIAPINFATG
jgi:hypothetical protein